MSILSGKGHTLLSHYTHLLHPSSLNTAMLSRASFTSSSQRPSVTYQVITMDPGVTFILTKSLWQPLNAFLASFSTFFIVCGIPYSSGILMVTVAILLGVRVSALLTTACWNSLTAVALRNSSFFSSLYLYFSIVLMMASLWWNRLTRRSRYLMLNVSIWSRRSLRNTSSIFWHLRNSSTSNRPSM